MCDFSLASVRSRPAKVGDKLTTRDFGTGTRGFCDPTDPDMAVCIRPGTELAFKSDIVAVNPAGFSKVKALPAMTAIFRQVNTDKPSTHHDALELSNGQTVLLTLLAEGQEATVLQLPAEPKTPTEAREQERVTYVG